MSLKSGVAFEYKTEFAPATKLIGDEIIISFFFHLSARAVRCRAAVPLETTQQYLEPKKLLNLFSNFWGFGVLGNLIQLFN